MDKYLTKEQMFTILDNAPPTVDKEKLLKKYNDSGWKIQGYNDTPETQPQTPVQPEKETGGVKGFLKDIVSAPATMIARPLQLGAELIMPGDNTEAIDKFSKEKLGGIVAPIPQNMGDVKKDIGRGVQTVAFGVGSPVVAGATFGAGSSLEKGNDLLSLETAFNTALGGAGGKVLSLIGKPILNVAGKVVGEVTPKFLKDLASKGTGEIQKFAAKYEIMPQFGKNVINKVSSVGNTTKNAIKAELPIKQTIDKTISAISKSPKGKAGIEAYKEIATKGRGATKKGFIKPQGIDSSKYEKEVGKRLNDEGIFFKDKPIDDLKTIGNALSEIETKKLNVVNNDPEMVYSIQKDLLARKLDKIKINAKSNSEFVGDNQKVYNNVVNFTKDLIQKIDDNPAAGLKAKSELMNVFKKKYKTIFKNGYIDTSTPAGAAVKEVNDVFGTHLYDITPNGSELKRLMQIDTDLFYSLNNIAEKAMEQDGQRVVGQLIEQFPILKGFGLGALTGSKSSILYGFK